MKIKKLFGMKKLRTWYWEHEIKPDIAVFSRYQFNVHLITGDVIKGCTTSNYHNINCSIGEYLLCENTLTIEGKTYPREAIKFIEETGRQEEYIYCYKSFMGIGGLSEREVIENQKEYNKYLNRYKKEESQKNGRDKNSGTDSKKK